jgi:tetratricopeptide (TPR) repeat protein
MAEKYSRKIEYAIEAEFHARFIGQTPRVATRLLDSQIGFATALQKEGKFEEAKGILDQIIKVKDSREILRLSTIVDAELGFYAHVVDKARRLFIENPSDSMLFQILTKLSLKHSREDVAEQLVAIAQGTGIDETSIFIVQGDIARRRKKLDQAEWYYREALNSDSRKRTAWPYYHLGVTLIKLNEIEKAIDILYEGLILCEKKPWFGHNVKSAISTQLGIAYVLNGDLAAGEPIIMQNIEQYPEHPEIVHAYAFLIVKREGVNKAEEAYEKFKMAKPRSAKQRALYNLFYALFLSEVGKKVEANDHFSLAHKYEENNVYIMIKYAESLYTLAVLSKIELNKSLAEEYARKCGDIIRKILAFDHDNGPGNRIRVDLYNEFQMQISDIKSL